MSKTGANSAIAVKPMVSVVGVGTGFDLHDMVFAAAVGGGSGRSRSPQ